MRSRSILLAFVSIVAGALAQSDDPAFPAQFEKTCSSLDYGIWAERAARRVEEFAALDKSRDEIKGLALWTDGRLSDRLCEELKKRGIAFRMLALADTTTS